MARAGIASFGFELSWLILVAGVGACSFGNDRIELPPLDAAVPTFSTSFHCTSLEDRACERDVHRSCKRVGDFVEIVSVDCEKRGLTCDLNNGCVACIPGARRCQSCTSKDEQGCNAQRTEICNEEGTAYEPAEVCDWDVGDACINGQCTHHCAAGATSDTYLGCEFYAVDLDNVAIDALNDASSQQFAVAVANPYPLPVTVSVEINDAAFGKSRELTTLVERVIAPNYLEVFNLPRREVDGSSETGLNDGTHTAVTSNAFRLRSSHPVTSYQFNPLDNVNVFSNDASLLLPTSAIGSKYMVVSWPETIGNSDDPKLDFDPDVTNEDLRAFLTIVGTADDTHVTVTLGKQALKIVGAGDIPKSGPGDVIKLDIGPFDVINLESAGPTVDFTGSTIEASRGVVVFVGSEASDVPAFEDRSKRQCCADHLEEQLFPVRTLGMSYIVSHMPPRAAAVNLAAPKGTSLGVPEVNETEQVRILAAGDGTTRVRTSLPAPNDDFSLEQGEQVTLASQQDFAISADGPLAVLQALPGQEVTGIPRQFPGGDPAIVMVPPSEQYRSDYIFLTPDNFAFDFVTIAAPRDAEVELDGKLVTALDACSATPLASSAAVPSADGFVVYRCQLSFPEVVDGDTVAVLPGRQDDGVHHVLSSEPVGIIVYGFDAYVSYAYAGGLNLQPLL